MSNDQEFVDDDADLNGDDESMDETVNNGSTETESTGINWNRVAVRGDNGTVDNDATMSAIIADFERWRAINEVGNDVVANAVKAVYTEFPLVKFNMNAIISHANRVLKTHPDATDRVAMQIRRFLQGESKRFEKTFQGLYHIRKGKKGGVVNVNPAYVETYKKERAAKAASAK